MVIKLRLLSALGAVAACFTATFATADRASAGEVLDKVRAAGAVHCGSVERPGLAAAGEGGSWQGLNVDVCRAVAAAVLGSADKIVFQEYETPKQFDSIRNGEDDLFFLTASEIDQQHLSGRVLPGPTVFIATHAVMVPKGSPEKHVADLAGSTICYLAPSTVENSVNAFFDRIGKPFLPRPFTEDGEMVDAYKVQYCHALAYERTMLATLADDGGINNLKNRILPEPVASFPVMAATPVRDGQWSAIVAWTVHTLISAERPEGKWYHGGVKSLPVDGADLGLDKGWQDRVVKAVGHYGDIYDRHLGKTSALGIARGPNANQIAGGLLMGPFLE
ncbi:MAG: transporter substrate-binding domain-containing protein [Telmatospirillum sp.]|nr:transporter substrate-binding domain-containing protein [Telmatospirillum sp.]